MTFGSDLLQNPVAQAFTQALGWTLVHFIWQGALIAVALWCLLALMARRSAETRYAVACLALASTVTLPVITFARLAIAQYRLVKLDVGSVADAHTFTVPLVAGVTSRWEQFTTLLNHAIPWMVLAWCGGVLVFCSRLGLGLTVARGLKLRDTQPASDGMQSMFNALCQRLAVDRAVRLAHSVRVRVPTVIGWLKPVVLLPVECFTGLSERQIEALLAHELAHIRRNDYLVSVLQSIVETTLFYQPAVWWISKQVRREREYCCDEMAVAVCGDRLAYARALSLLEEQRALLPEMALGANGGVLTMRIRRLLGYREEMVSSNMAWIVVLAVVIVGSGGIIGRLAYAEAKPAPTMPARTLQQAQENQAALQAAVTDAQKQAADAERQALETVDKSEGERRELSRMERDAERSGQDGSGLSTADQKQLDEARKNIEHSLKKLDSDEFKSQLKEAERRLNSGELKKQLQEAQKQLKSPEFQKHIQEALDAAMKANSAEIRTQIAEAQKQLSQSRAVQEEIRTKLNSPEFRKQMDAAKLAAKQVNSPEFRKQLENAKKQAAQFNTPEFREKIRQMIDQARQASTPDARENIQNMIAANSSSNGTDAQPSAAPAPTRPIRVSSAVMAGQVVSQVPPEYPPDAKNAHIQGTVVLKAIVGKTGDVEQLSVVSGPPELTHSAIDAVSKWKYKPYLLNGQPVPVLTTINVNYSLTEDSGAAPAPQSSVVPGSMPKVIHTEPVEYTPEARAAKIQGPVVVSLIVNQRGIPENVRVVRGLDPGLDRNAIASINQYRFEPAMQDGHPVEKAVSIEVQYRLF